MGRGCVSETAQPQCAFGRLLKPGQTPGGRGGAMTLVIQEQLNVAQIQVIARKGRSASLARRLSSFLGIRKALAPREGGQTDFIHLYATGPQEYWVFSTKLGAQALERQLADALENAASLFDQTHGRFIIRISGDDAVRLLAKGTSLDLDESVFPALGASHTTLEHIPALVVRRTSPDCFELSVPRSYAGSLQSWLGGAAREFGYILT